MSQLTKDLELQEEQLRLDFGDPFSLRLRLPDAMRIFWLNYWCHRKCARTTTSNVKRLETFFANSYLDQISKADVESYRRYHLAMGLNDQTINHDHMILSRLFRKFEEYKEGKYVNGQDFSRIVLPTRNPAALVPRAKIDQYARQVFVTPEQKKLLCSLADEDLAEIIDTLYWSELRQGDLFSITSENVDTAKWIILGIQSKSITSRKPGGLPFKVPIPEKRREVIERRLKTAKTGSPLFPKINLQKRWHELRSRAALHDPFFLKVQLRDMRPSAHSRLLDEGVDLETLRQKAGWATYDMIKWYDKRPDKRVKEATDRLADL